jgi:predicted DNA-binding ribbon-helix-helix protein
VSEAPLAAPPTAEDAGPRAAGSLRFRVLKRGEWRRAFRLEDEFWTVLEEAAAAEGLKIADYVRGLLERTGEDAANASSLLRVTAVAYMTGQRDRLLRSTTMAEVVHPAIAAPVPCFVVSEKRALVSFNAEFSNYVMARTQAVDRDEVGKARLTLDVPVDKLIEILSQPPGRVALCGFTIRTPSATATGRARVTLAQPSRRDLVVGYVMPG